jgi:CheY-like chemotaxis protein
LLSWIKGVRGAPLLRRTWLQLLSAGIIFLAALQVLLGYQTFLNYKSGVESCVLGSIQEQSNNFAQEIKNDQFEPVVSQLNAIEYRCAYPDSTNLSAMIHNEGIEQASFTWIIEKQGEKRHQIGKNLLKGPKAEFLYPLSLWSENGSGEYWVGSIKLSLYFGEFVDQVIENGWKVYAFHLSFMFVMSVVGLVLVYRNYTKPNAEFLEAIDGWRSDTQSLRRLIERYDGELVGIWKLYVESREKHEIERFELESQIRDLEGHISKLERGQSGQSLNTERASLDLKQSLTQILTELDHASPIPELEGVRNYVDALLGVCSNLHERALTESAEIRVLTISYSPRIMIAQVFQEFKERFIRRHIHFQFSVSNEIPDFVLGDPEKVKRLIRNAIRRALMQPHIETIEFKATFGTKASSGVCVDFELIAVPNQVAAMNLSDSDREAFDRLENGPTPMLEILCQLMGARWSFTSGMDGELRQSLTLPIQVSRMQRISQPVQSARLERMRGVYLRVGGALNERHWHALKERMGDFTLMNDERQLFELSLQSKGALANTNIVIISDSLKMVPIIDMVASLRRAMPPNSVIVLVAKYPQIGDARYYHDIGVNAYLPESHCESYLVDLVSLALIRKSHSSGVPELTTRYSVLDQYELNEDLSLPATLYYKYKNTVLMVSQDLVAIELLRQSCQRFRIRFVHFSHAFEAIEAFKHELFDLVLVDESVEDVDSLSIVQLFRQVEEKRTESLVTPLVALSRNASDKELEMFEGAGVTELLKKPMMSGEIALMFKQILK